MDSLGLIEYFKLVVEPSYNEINSKFAALSSSSSKSALDINSNDGRRSSKDDEEELVKYIDKVRAALADLIRSSNRAIGSLVSNDDNNHKYFEISINQSKILLSLLEIMWWAQLRKFAIHLNVPVQESEKSVSYLLFDRSFYERCYKARQALPDLSDSVELIDMLLLYCESKVFFPYVGSAKYVYRITLSLLCIDRIIFNSTLSSSSSSGSLTSTVSNSNNSIIDSQTTYNSSFIISSPFTMFSRLYTDLFRTNLIRELRKLSSPDWMNQASFRVIRGILETQDGLFKVMNVYLTDISENANKDTVDVIKLYMMVAKFLTSVPPKADKSDFYKTLSGQMLDVFIIVIHVIFRQKNSERDKYLKQMNIDISTTSSSFKAQKSVTPKDLESLVETANQCFLLLSLMISRVAHLQPAICKEFIIEPILAPLLKINLFDSRTLLTALIRNPEEILGSSENELDGGILPSSNSSNAELNSVKSKTIFLYDDIVMSINGIHSILTASPNSAPIISVLLDSKGLEYFLTFREMLESFDSKKKIAIVSPVNSNNNYINNIMDKTNVILQLMFSKTTNPDRNIESINRYLFSLPKYSSKVHLLIDNDGYLVLSNNTEFSNVTLTSALHSSDTNNSISIASIIQSISSSSSSSLSSSKNESPKTSDSTADNSNSGEIDSKKEEREKLSSVVNLLKEKSAKSPMEVSSQFILEVSTRAQYFCNFVNSLKSSGLADPTCASTLPLISIVFLHYLRIYLTGEGINEVNSDQSEDARIEKELNILIDKSTSQNIIFMTLLSYINIEDILTDGVQILKILGTFLEVFAKSSNIIAKFSVASANSLKDHPNSYKVDDLSHQSASKKKVLIEEISSTVSEDNEQEIKGDLNSFTSDTSIPSSLHILGNEEKEVVNEETDDTELQLEQLEIVLGLLSNILEFGRFPRPPEEEEIIRHMLQPLLSISWGDIRKATSQNDDVDSDDEGDLPSGESKSEVNLSEMAQRLAVKIMTMSKKKAASLSSLTADNENSTSEFTISFKSIQEIIERVELDLRSSEPSERAMGLHLLTDYITRYFANSHNRIDLKELLKTIDTVLPFLADHDSYVYSHAVQSLRIISDLKGCRAIVVDKLTNIFETVASKIVQVKKELSIKPGTSGKSSSSPSPSNLLLLPIGRYTVLAEVLSLVLKRAGDSAAQYTPRIISISIVLSRISLSKSEISLMEKYIDLHKTTILRSKKSEDEDEDDDKVENLSEKAASSPTSKISKSETLSKPVSMKGEHTNSGSKTLSTKNNLASTSSKATEDKEREAAAVVADYALLRQSSIVLLSEAVVASGWSCTRINDVLDVVNHVLTLESNWSQYSIACRRAAALVISHILNGLNKKLFSLSDAGSILKQCYSSLKKGMADRDSIVQFHCGQALAALDEMYLDKFKPTKAELKVRILDWG